MYRIFFVALLLFVSCAEYTPKPRGYFRIEPTQAYYIKLPVRDLPYSFSISDKIEVQLPEEEQEGWINLSYPEFKATIYCSYLPVAKGHLPELTRETFTFVERMGKPFKATAYENPEEKVYGLFFDVKGDVASPIQFYLTDSLTHFFRGALYYEMKPNSDSIAPMTDYLRKDLVELVQTFNWKD